MRLVEVAQPVHDVLGRRTLLDQYRRLTGAVDLPDGALRETRRRDKAALQGALGDTELRARAVRPYVQVVADALAAEGFAVRQDVDVVHVADDVEAAAAPVSALVWDERWGW